MKRALLVVSSLILTAFLANAWAPNPFLGVWFLDHQEFNGQKLEPQKLALRITTDGPGLRFAFSVPINNIDFVSLSYSAKVDGPEGDVKDSRMAKIGTIKVTSSGPLKYNFVLKGENRPQSSGSMTVSADGKTLTSESDSSQGGKAAHLVQSFIRH
jgi:hypothetical protein